MTKTLVEKHFDKVSSSYDSGKEKYSFYYSNLKKLLGELIPKNKKVLEFGCGTGDLLASLNPKVGYGYDISKKMIGKCKFKYRSMKNLRFSTIWPSDYFDFIFMSDVIEHLENPEVEFKKISKFMNSNSQLIITMANPLWEPLLMFWERMGWKMKEGPHLRLSTANLQFIIYKSQLKIIKHDYKLLIPIKIPFITNFANKYLEKYFKKLCFLEFFVCQKCHLK